MRELPIRPILASLRRHKLVALLLMLQVAATCAVMCNVGFMVVGRWQCMHMPSGIDEDALELIRVRDLQARKDVLARHRADIDRLRALPGVQSVAIVDSLPFSQDTWSVGMRATCAAPDENPQRLTLYNGTPGELAALGIRLVEGRDFAAGDYVPMHAQDNFSGLDQVNSLIVSKDVAAHNFPGQYAVGRQVCIDKRPITIVGVVDRIAPPSPGRMQARYDTAFMPMLPDDTDAMYVLRCDPATCDAVGRQASQTLLDIARDRLLSPPQRFAQLRAQFFRRDRTMIGLLIASALGLLFVTALGIAGLANFWVQQRTRQIGIRRAVGATRGDILRYFQTENFLIVGAGIALGLVLALGLNMVLMTQYELPRLPMYYLPITAMAMWLLGQGAVLNPALRAAAVPPVVATRSV